MPVIPLQNPVLVDVPEAILDRDRLLEEASAIASEIRERRRYTQAGSVNWVGPRGYGTPGSPLVMETLDPHLYNGTTGVAIFFAALARVTGDAQHRELSLEIVAPLRRKLIELLGDSERAERLRISVGGLIGLGSFIYGFLKISELLDEPALLREAHDATALITPPRIKGDHRVRIQTGSAGAALALLALHRRLPEPNRSSKTPLELACDCAQNLLDKRVSFDDRPRAWPLSPGKPPLGGFSYGAAGVCYALLQTWRASDRPELLAAAEEGFDFLRSLYSPERKGWRDMRAELQVRYRCQGHWKDWWASGSSISELDRVPEEELQAAAKQPPEHQVPAMWCHGSSGIALGRVAALDIADTPEIRQEIYNALDVARSFADDPEIFAGAKADDICCGHMGRVEVLHYASQKLGDEELLSAAQRLAHRVWRRSTTQGRYELSSARGTDAFAPYLFQGTAGIGYTFLRLAEPEALPCLLVLE